MLDTKILYSYVEKGQPRSPVVSREEWQAIFREYPDSLRYRAANLAAHNWDVALINGRMLVASSWGGGYWFEKNGMEVRLTEQELDGFYPPAVDERWPEASHDYTSNKYRLVKFNLPSPPVSRGDGIDG